MADAGSVTQLLRQMHAGSESAFAVLLDRYRPLLLRRANRRLDPAHRRAVDAEDVAQLAALDLFRGLKDGRWRQLADRHDLVAILTRLTDCRAIKLVEHELAEIRGGGRVRGESAVDGPHHGSGPRPGLDGAVAGREPGPEEVVSADDSRAIFLDRLGDTLRPYAERLLDGGSVPEIAEAMGCSERTVARKLALIRAQWLEGLAAVEAASDTRS